MLESNPSSSVRRISFYCALFVVFLVLVLINRWGYEYRARYSAQLEDVADQSDDALPRSIALIMERIQLERRNLIDENCRKITWRRQSRPARFYVEDRHRLMYCYVPKVASTNLKRLMLILSGEHVETNDLSSIPSRSVHEENRMRKFEPYGAADAIRSGLGNYTKVIFVRDPLERLASAYQDKFADVNSSSKAYQTGIGTEIIRKYRNQPSELSLKNGHDVTFAEFVSYVIDEWKGGRRQLDVHWRPMIDLCLPCSMEYDIVGKFETLHQDVDFLLQRLNESNLSRLFRTNRTHKASSFWKRSVSQLSYQQMSDLLRIYEDDFRLFGYQYTIEICLSLSFGWLLEGRCLLFIAFEIGDAQFFVTGLLVFHHNLDFSNIRMRKISCRKYVRTFTRFPHFWCTP